MNFELLKKLENAVYSFPTKNKEGFTDKEQNELLKQFPEVNMKAYHDAQQGITCLMLNDEIVVYHSDIVLALKCGLENRNPNLYEWD